MLSWVAFWIGLAQEGNMVAYWKLKYAKWELEEIGRDVRRKAVVEGINRLKSALETRIPARKTGKNLLLGTWNLRNFDDNRFKSGPRLPESFFYLAEVISAFDIIAIQEICNDIAPLQNLMEMIGGDYKFIITDLTEDPSGNRERLGFIYDSRTVEFRGVAGELVLPLGHEILNEGKNRQFARAPFGCEFQSGWFKFSFSTVHIFYGEKGENTPQHARRVEEIRKVAGLLARRAKNDASQAYFLVGDFNIEGYQSKTFDALEEHKFKVFKYNLGSNAERNHFFDQISFWPRPEMVEPVDPSLDAADRVFNPFDSVFRDEDFDFYDPEIMATVKRRRADAEQEVAALTAKLQKPGISDSLKASTTKKLVSARETVGNLDDMLADKAKRQAYYDEWKTYQISDHLPLFVELNVDFSRRYLQSFITAPVV
jgi:hypothetical protein